MDRKAWKIITLVVLIANIQLIIFAISNGLSISFFFIHAADILGILSIITLVFLHFLGDDLGPIEQQFIPEIRKQLVDRFPTGFLYEDLIAATNNFRYKLGSGESSSVFKGKLNDGTSVAVKRVEPSEYGEWEFQRDISTVAMVKHDHLVHLRGYCSHMTETGKNIFLIVYDFYPFGSLDSWIIPKIQGGRYLDWKKRYTVALDVAKALVYLHHDCRPRILHLKIKLKNILIDDNFRAVLSDFGFPKLMGKDEYTPPESGLGHEISETCDIHSFGKVLLDLFFGGRDDFYTKYDFSQQQIFHAFMQKSLKGKKLRDLIDKRLIEDKEAINEKEASTLVHVVLCCLDEDPNKRPGDMQKVVGMLEARKLSGNSQAVFDIAKSAAVLVYRHISYRFCYKKYVNDLQSKVKDNLLRLENDVKGKVNLARDAGDVIHKVVEHWLEKVDEVRDEVGELHCQAGEIKSCFKGWLSARYRLGKDSKKKIVIVDELLTEGRSFSSVSNPAPVPPQLVEHFDAFASREPTKKEVIQALMDRNTHLIGVYGMGGVGKTTMMKEIYREVEAKLFHKVVLLTVSQNPDLRGIQTQIAKSMGLTIEEDAMKIRAQRLSKRLKQEKSILLILDDVQTTLELAEVGIIPCRDGQNTCKVLITSRNLDVCRSMKTTKNIEVQRLSERDSLELFLRNVGGVDCKALRKISADIASECEGLPFAILAFARALQHSDEAVWPDIIKQIRKSFFEGMSLFDDLQRKVQNDLVRLETDLKAKVDLARKNGDVIHKVVEQWLDNVAKVRNEMNELHHEAEKINSCFKGRHSACHRLCEESEKKVVVVDELLVEGRSFSIVSNPAPVPAWVAEHFDAFASREVTKKKVIKALKDSNTKLVGVHGMGGVGKTTLMKEICKQVEETKLFDKVVFATVSQNPDLRGIQTQIAESLGMKIEEQSIPVRAARLSNRLKQEKSILLMFDDLWTRLELSDVGIDLDEGSCKVVITSRKLDVCNSMKTTKNIDVKVLSKDDSLQLFRQEVGDVDSDALREMSEKIVNECGGLPLAIVTLARTLRNKDKGFWTDVIPQLKKSMFEGMDLVNASIKLSYDYLRTSKTKSCFLLCALFPEDHKVTMDALVGYAMGEDLLGDVETLSEARGNLRIMLKSLVSSGLLLEGVNKENDEGYVMMHDIVRDTAISIARENESESIMNAGLGLQKWPKLKEAGKCLRLSLMSNNIRKVPADTPECSQLVTLSLARNWSLADIPDGFFEGMKCLATLDLSNIGISSLPESLSSLKNCLRSLYLDNCTKLQDISVIGNLKTLEILGLQSTRISRLPEEINGLINLKMLDLSYTRNLKCIPPKVISSLFNLEQLNMRRSFRKWEIEGTGDNASLAEVASLTNLTSLQLDIDNTKWLSTDIGPCHHWEKLENFEIRVEKFQIINRTVFKFRRLVSLGTSSDSFPVAAWVNVLMDTTYELYLDQCEGLKNVLQLNPKGRFYNLKTLVILECWQMEYVVNVEEQVPETMFPNLEILELGYMNELKAIWNGPLVERSFEKLKVVSISYCGKLVNVLPSLWWTRLQNLEEIDIQYCHKLEKVFESDGFEDGHASILKLRSIKSSINFIALPPIFSNLKNLYIKRCLGLKCIFPIRILQGLQQLEKLIVFDCFYMEELFEFEDGSMTIRLPRLRDLILWKLPRLSSFFSHRRVLLDCPSLEDLEISECPNLNWLPFGPQSIPKLEKFLIKTKLFETLEWDDLSVKSQLQQFLSKD